MSTLSRRQRKRMYVYIPSDDEILDYERKDLLDVKRKLESTMHKLNKKKRREYSQKIKLIESCLKTKKVISFNHKKPKKQKYREERRTSFNNEVNNWLTNKISEKVYHRCV